LCFATLPVLTLATDSTDFRPHTTSFDSMRLSLAATVATVRNGIAALTVDTKGKDSKETKDVASTSTSASTSTTLSTGLEPSSTTTSHSAPTITTTVVPADVHAAVDPSTLRGEALARYYSEHPTSWSTYWDGRRQVAAEIGRRGAPALMQEADFKDVKDSVAYDDLISAQCGLLAFDGGKSCALSEMTDAMIVDQRALIMTIEGSPATRRFALQPLMNKFQTELERRGALVTRDRGGVKISRVSRVGPGPNADFSAGVEQARSPAFLDPSWRAWARSFYLPDPRAAKRKLTNDDGNTTKKQRT